MATIQLKRDTSANWTAANPTLALAEPGLETDTNRIKYGDGVSSWQNLQYASNVAFREVTSFPTGIAGDTAGTIVVNGAGKTFICTSTYVAQQPISYDLTTSETVLNGQDINGNMSFTYTVSDNAQLAGWLYNIALNNGTVTLSSPVLDGARTTAPGIMNYDTNHVTFSIQVPYVSGDPTEIDSGTTFTVTVTPPQPVIWDKVGDTGNITFNGQTIKTATNSNINLAVNSEVGEDTEIDLYTNYIDLYTVNEAQDSYAELYISNQDTTQPYVYVGVQPHGANSELTWTFNQAGHMVFPDATVQTTAYPGPVSTDPTVWAVQATSSTKASFTQAVAYDSAGNSFALMWQGLWNSSGETKSSVVKLNANGNTVWAVDLVNGDSINPWSLCCDASDNVYIIVQKRVSGELFNNVVVKLSGSDGSILWQVDIQDSQTSNNMQAVPMVYSTTGFSFNGIVVAGTANNGTDNDFFIAFIGSDGNISAPTSTFGDQYDQEAYSVAVNNTTGDILLVGIKESNTDTHYYLEMVKFNITSPSAIWQKQVSVTGDATYDVKGTDCCLLADGNWAILATHNGNSTYGVITMKVSNTDGSVIWSREVGQGCSNVSSSLTTSTDGNIYISASTYNNKTNTANIPEVSRLVAAYDTSGTPLWQKFFEATGSNLLIDGNWWNNPGFSGKLLAIYSDTHLLLGSMLIPLTPYPANQLGVVAQIPTTGDNEVIGPFELYNSGLSGAPVTLTVEDTTFAFTTSTQTLAAGSTVASGASALTYTVFHGGSRPNQLAVDSKSITLQADGTLIDEVGRNVTGELVQNTDSSNNFSNVPVGIKNASGYKRLVGASSTAQVWLDLNDVGTQLNINPNWINGMIIDYQVLSSNLNYTGSMTGQIIIASNETNAMNVTHIESAITESNNQSDVVFANLNIWQPYNGTLRAYRTDGYTQQLDFIWTAKVFYNASEAYC